MRTSRTFTSMRDENAITVQAQFDTWQPIGYIPGSKVPKVTEAIRNKEITKIVITNVKYQYIFPIASLKFIATISISKIGKWRKNKENYKYNEDISNDFCDESMNGLFEQINAMTI